MWPFTSAGEGSGKSQASGSSPASPLAGPPPGVNLQDEAAAADKCPVDHDTRSRWLRQQQSSEGDSNTTSALAMLSSQHTSATDKRPGTSSLLSTDRVVSSIPRLGAKARAQDQGGHSSDANPSTSANWVYPSPAQFYAAMERKNHNPQAQDMDVVVPIHNAVNERAWQEILRWERLADGGESWNRCGGPQLVSFKGKPRELTWKAWVGTLFGYQRPFDRHDWEVDRCGQRIKYVIDFYTGRTSSSLDARTSLSFYLDVRPSPATWEGIRMRCMRLFASPVAEQA